MLPGLLMIPLGVGVAVPAMTTLLLSVVPRRRSGVASGVLNSVRQAGGALGVAVFGALLNAKAVAGARISLSISAIFFLVAAFGVAAAILKEAGSRRQEARSRKQEVGSRKAEARS